MKQSKSDFESQSPYKKTTIILTIVGALCIAVCSYFIELANDQALFNKNDAVDHWNFFQAKNIRGKIYEMEIERLKWVDETDPFYEDKISLKKEYEETVERYENEMTEIRQKAEEYTEKSATYDKEADILGIARIFFELAIVFNAVFMLDNMKVFLYSSIASNAFAILLILWTFL